MKYTLNDFQGAGYIFNPASKTITISGMEALNKTNILSIINATDNKIIMQINNPTLGIETISNNILTLVYNTSTMLASDELVFIFDIEIQPTVVISENRLTRILKQLSVFSIKDSSGRQRITIDSIVPSVVIGSGTITTVGTVTTVSTLSNITNIGGRSADLRFQSQSRNTFANNTRRHLSYTQQ